MSAGLLDAFFGTVWVVICLMLTAWIICVIAAWVVLLIRRKGGQE